MLSILMIVVGRVVTTCIMGMAMGLDQRADTLTFQQGPRTMAIGLSTERKNNGKTKQYCEPSPQQMTARPDSCSLPAAHLVLADSLSVFPHPTLGDGEGPCSEAPVPQFFAHRLIAARGSGTAALRVLRFDNLHLPKLAISPGGG